MAEQIKNKVTFLGRVWCRAMHKQTLWPIHGEYECSTCFRRYRVPWEPANPVPVRQEISHAHQDLAEAA